jgi:TRAP-type C4-dicarboxylate transport system permease small subunit
MWQPIYKFADRLSLLLGWLAGGAIFLIVVLLAAEIVLRNVFVISLSFVWEYSTYLHITAIFFALSFTLRTGGHIRVTLMAKVLPRLFAFTSTILGLLISSFLTFALVKLCFTWGMAGKTSGTIDNMPLIYPISLVAFGATMLTIQLILRLVHLVVGTPEELPWAAGPSAE